MLSSRGATLVRISRIPPTIYTRAGADIIGPSKPVLQPSTVVTDLWRTSQISGLRILASRIQTLYTSAPKTCWGKQIRASKMLALLWLLNCHMLPRRLIEFVPVKTLELALSTLSRRSEEEQC